MKRIFAFLGLLLLLPICSYGQDREICWGGPGYDPELKRPDDPPSQSSKFRARRSLYQQGIIEILIDSEKTVKKVVSMSLLEEPEKKAVSSEYCSKAMRHITAPWACAFRETQIGTLSGKGQIRVLGESGELLLEDTVDLNSLNSLKN